MALLGSGEAKRPPPLSQRHGGAEARSLPEVLAVGRVIDPGFGAAVPELKARPVFGPALSESPPLVLALEAPETLRLRIGRPLDGVEKLNVPCVGRVLLALRLPKVRLCLASGGCPLARRRATSIVPRVAEDGIKDRRRLLALRQLHVGLAGSQRRAGAQQPQPTRTHAIKLRLCAVVVDVDAVAAFRRSQSEGNLARVSPRCYRPAVDSAWRMWGPYLAERQWGTVREDYSATGDAWEYFSHSDARSRAYRWGEDGIGGFCDARQQLCVAVALWNGRDPILKERFFGLTNAQGNHGEDVKELYYYLDGVPSHAYMRMLYKYPHAEFPYARLVEENARRGKGDPEFELIDTGVFDDDRYFDVEIEHAKADPEDLLLRVTATNRGPEPADLHLLPHVWFRNEWAWDPKVHRPRLRRLGPERIEAVHPRLGVRIVDVEPGAELLFCDNETNAPALFGTEKAGFFKDGIDEAVVGGNPTAVNPAGAGTKAAAHVRVTIAPGASSVVRLRLRPPGADAGLGDFDEAFARARIDADGFYRNLQHRIHDAQERSVQRQAFAGLLWSKMFYRFDVARWLDGDPAMPTPPPERKRGRNHDWEHLNNAEVLSMPDTWEYPWYAAWDLAFHCIAFAVLDPDFAKDQLKLITREWYMHPNGQLPAYEWHFDDVNPPVHAWATWRVFEIDRSQRGDEGDIEFLEAVFHKLLLNFTWWVNRKDRGDRNVFQGGFLGLDNIGVFDRSKPLPTGGFLDQADGTAWMAMYCLNLMRIALELALHNPVYEDIATKFFEHFLLIAKAMGRTGERDLWDEQDQFYYDVLRLPGDHMMTLRLRSMVGLVPLFAVEVLEPELLARVPNFRARLEWVLEHRPDLASLVSRWHEPGRGERRLLSLLRGRRMKRLLRRMLDEDEFLSEFGVRAMSKVYRDEPFTMEAAGQSFEVRYQPAESDSYLFGGNSNWRGPIWMPVNYLIIESLQRFHYYYTDDFKVECPTGSGRLVTIDGVAEEITRRLKRIFLPDPSGRRPVWGGREKIADDPHFRDHILFYEYFHGDDGRGVGAAHQTGWTALIAKLIHPRRRRW